MIRPMAEATSRLSSSVRKQSRAIGRRLLYQHQSTLRLILQGLGIQTYPAAASTAPEMSEFF